MAEKKNETTEAIDEARKRAHERLDEAEKVREEQLASPEEKAKKQKERQEKELEEQHKAIDSAPLLAPWEPTPPGQPRVEVFLHPTETGVRHRVNAPPGPIPEGVGLPARG